jgi:hypothetical protein
VALAAGRAQTPASTDDAVFGPAAFLGDVDAARIRGAYSPTVGQGWRTVVINLTDGEPVAIKVPATAVQRFIDDVTAAPRG